MRKNDDVISRQAAIDAIKNQTCLTYEEIFNRCLVSIKDENGWVGGIKDAIEALIDLPSAQPETHGKRTETHACDCIGRQEAIAVADSTDYLGLAVEDVKKVTDEVVKGLKQLPSAQPKKTVDNYIESLPTSPLLVGKMPSVQQENDWTPVSKKKHPDKEGEYLVTDDAGGMEEVDKDVFMFLDDGTPCWLYSQNVTAWRELPEPYKERREE